ncbi:putative HNH endonuclease protein [Rhizobium phage RHph_N28_1]|nr:putative HNH endonuclease protein [Rhizobium phage RHph_N28_1]QIG74274.1 putative HNH endonuclease protein [Rhizobium phage RHph_N42]QXV73934.1 putative HNH endonuclease protein [Rhizobium phage RHph_N46]
MQTLTEKDRKKANAHHFDCIGKTFGRWTVRKVKRNAYGIYHYRCKCWCGSFADVQAAHIKSGASFSCGCWKSEESKARIGPARSSFKHGGYAEKSMPVKYRSMYVRWTNIIRRCHDETSTDFEYYGARGIKVCKRWRESFDAFLADVGYPPTLKHELDREDNDKGYSKSNCRWVTHRENMLNTRRAKKYKVRKHGL